MTQAYFHQTKHFFTHQMTPQTSNFFAVNYQQIITKQCFGCFILVQEECLLIGLLLWLELCLLYFTHVCLESCSVEFKVQSDLARQMLQVIRWQVQNQRQHHHFGLRIEVVLPGLNFYDHLSSIRASFYLEVVALIRSKRNLSFLIRLHALLFCCKHLVSYLFSTHQRHYLTLQPNSSCPTCNHLPPSYHPQQIASPPTDCAANYYSCSRQLANCFEN